LPGVIPANARAGHVVRRRRLNQPAGKLLRGGSSARRHRGREWPRGHRGPVTTGGIRRGGVFELLLKRQRGHGDALAFCQVFLVHHFQCLNCRVATLHGRRCWISATRPSGNGASCS
jgi:hypothetical protein